MKRELENDLGTFEGFNFRTQSAICETLTAEDVANWDHDARGEAEFWPEGSEPFVKLLAGKGCTGSDLLEIDRIYSELDGEETELCKAVALREMGYSLEQISRDKIDEHCLYVYGLGYLRDLKKTAAWDLFEELHPEAAKAVSTITGLHFDEDDFLVEYAVYEIETGERQGYIVLEPT